MDILKLIKDALGFAAACLIIGIALTIPAYLIGGLLQGPKGQADNWASNTFYSVFVGGSIIGFIICFVSETNAANSRNEAKRESLRESARREKEGKLAAEERERQEQQNIHLALNRTADESIHIFDKLPKSLLMSEQFLDQADRDFSEQAFSPFWSNIEKAMTALGVFDEGVTRISRNINTFGDLSGKYKQNTPRFPLAVESVRRVTAANTTVDRLNGIVRQSQRNFQFASIYEQRKTSQLIAAGFTTLAQAIDGMGQRISGSIDDLGDRISEQSSMLQNSMAAVADKIQSTNNSLEHLDSTITSSATEYQGHATRQWEALDNIQRGRKPKGGRAKDIFDTEPAP